MILALGLKIRLMSFFSGCKSAFSDSLAISHQLHNPFALVMRYAKKSAFVCFCWAFQILQISKSIHFTQIAKSIVSFLPVNMVYVFRRPFTSHVKPSKPMSKHFSVVDGNCPVSGFSARPRFSANQFWLVSMFKPKKISSCRVIPQKFFQLLNWNMVTNSHENEFTIKAI